MDKRSAYGRLGVQARAQQAYLEQRVQGAKPLELLIMLYEGMLKFVSEGERAMQAKEWEKAVTSLAKARRIATYLCKTLQPEGQEISAKLASLYAFCFENISKSSLTMDPGPLEAVKRVIADLMDGWIGLRNAEAQAPDAAAAESPSGSFEESVR